jgi:hypothetical protein
MIKIGDVYYDLAKLFHGLMVSHETISKNRYSIIKKNKKIYLKINNKKIYQKYINSFLKWTKINGYDNHKIKIITGLIFLNICALHHYPYSLFLYYTGKKILIDELVK